MNSIANAPSSTGQAFAAGASDTVTPDGTQLPPAMSSGPWLVRILTEGHLKSEGEDERQVTDFFWGGAFLFRSHPRELLQLPRSLPGKPQLTCPPLPYRLQNMFLSPKQTCRRPSLLRKRKR